MAPNLDMNLLGYFQPSDFDASGNLKSGIATQPWGKVYPGDCRYKDQNNDGKITVDDITHIGNGNIPLTIYGFGGNIRYKKVSR